MGLCRRHWPKILVVVEFRNFPPFNYSISLKKEKKCYAGTWAVYRKKKRRKMESLEFSSILSDVDDLEGEE